MGTEVSAGNYNGDLDLEEIVLNGALILLDQHGWEVMRKPISKRSEDDAAFNAAIKVYDSPMVKTYHFWTNFRKADGYHKYYPIRGKSDDTKNATHKGSGSSLTNYPKVAATGTIADIYVTFEVKDAYKNSYTGAATEGATKATSFFVKQGDHYLRTLNGTSLTTTSTTTTPNGMLWKVKPNFDIDDEMDFNYDIDSNGKTPAAPATALDKTATQNFYYTNRDASVYDTTNGQNGFDPYNLQIENADHSGVYLKTNATAVDLDAIKGSMVSTYSATAALGLGDKSQALTASSYYDTQRPKVTNATFMAVQDASGNMRLMPRFDHEKVANYSGTSYITLEASVDGKATQKAALLLPVTYHLMRRGTTFEGAAVEGGAQALGDAPSLPNRDKWNDRLNCTLDDTHYYSDPACTQEITAITGPDVYIPYTFDASTLESNTHVVFSDDYAHAKWMSLRFASNDTYYANYNGNAATQNIVRTYATTEQVAADDKYYFAFIGDPYKFRIVNKAAGDSKDAQQGAQSGSKTYEINLTDGTDHYDWSMVSPSGSSERFQILLTSTNLDTHRYYWNNYNPVILYDTKGQADDMLATRLKGAPFVKFTAPAENPVSGTKDSELTLTATATLNGGTSITSIAIEQDKGDGTWEEKAHANNAATVSYSFTPDAYGTFKFRAVAVTDGNDALTGYTTADLVVNVAPTAARASYNLVLIDKSGQELLTAENVTRERIAETLGDPWPDKWRSPAVGQYKYYTAAGKTNAQDAENDNLVDWATYADETVYVGYTLGTAVDIIKVNPQARQARSASDNTRVRDASKYTTMYMIKFKNGETFYQESGDALGEQDKAIYPYTNGDGQMYIYGEKKRKSDSESGSTTRERWPWFIVSENGDPYHVVVTSWKESHSFKPSNDTYKAKGFDKDITTNTYNYFRTYYNSTVGKVVTATVSDDPRETDTGITGGSAENEATEYMLLGTAGNYKLMTTNTITDATTTERRTVSNFQQYWKTYETISKNGTLSYTENKNPDFISKSITTHRYQAWANARPIDTDKPANKMDKKFAYDNHFYQTISMGETFDLEPVNLNGVLVLLDNHGWEIMRKPLAASGADNEAEVKAALRKYDSPMVKQYHFWTTGSKAPGYHKYTVSNLAKDGTSLADYPIVRNKYGNISDLYVTYDVKDAYANSYIGAATADAVKATAVKVRQGSSYLRNSGGHISTDGTGSDWYIKPNFNIDREMGYLYAGETGAESEAKSQADTELDNYNAGRNGFDPYNLQIVSIHSHVYDPIYCLTTDASNAELSAGAWTGNGTSLHLTEVTALGDLSATAYDNKQAHITNATFMAVQDANGNMRLMPRFDHGHVVQQFTVLTTPAADQPANDDSHGQTTRFMRDRDITYRLIRPDNEQIFKDQIKSADIGLALPRAYQSPLVDRYYYHKTEAHATNDATRYTSDLETLPESGDVWVTYSVADNYSQPWTISDTDGHYLHANFNPTNSSSGDRWWTNNAQDKDYDAAGMSVSTTTMPFLDGSYAWRFNADPYNLKLYNVGAQRYVTEYEQSTDNWWMNYMTANAKAAGVFTYAVLYHDENTDHAVLYDTSHERYARYDDNRWKFDQTDRANTAALTIEQLPQIDIRVVDASGAVEATIPGYYKSGASWTNSTADTNDHTPYYLQRVYTSGHRFCYDQAGTSAISGTVTDATVTENKAVYVRYTLDDDNWGTAVATGTDVTRIKTTGTDGAQWYLFRADANDDHDILTATAEGTVSYLNSTARTTITDDLTTDAAKRAQWAFVGTPYSLRILNRSTGPRTFMGISTTAADGDGMALYDKEATGVLTTWEVVTGMQDHATLLFFRPQGAISGQSPHLYISNTAIVRATTAGSYSDVTWVASTQLSKVALAVDPAALNAEGKATVDATATLTATATPLPSGTDLVSYLVIEQQNVDGGWDPVGTPFAVSVGTADARKNADTKVVTVTFGFRPEEATTYYFRARAVIDGFTQLTTDEVAEGGEGHPLAIVAVAPTISATKNIAELVLVDKSGTELYTETGVPVSRINTANSLSGRSGDPLSNDYRSPLVRRYYYYTEKDDAQNCTANNLVDWNSYDGSKTVYVGYAIAATVRGTSTPVDLNAAGFSSLNDLMNTRVDRSATDNTKVRDASKFGTRYLLKFKTSAPYYSEDTHDMPSDAETPAGSYVYPYTNGDGPLYIYNDNFYWEQINNGASTRTRWPWFLVSPTNDPYHVYVTSWQNSHTDSATKTARYSYLRTYYQEGVGIVTNNVTDAPETVDGESHQILPTEYMVVYGSGNDGRNCKLRTVEKVKIDLNGDGDTDDEGESDERRDVTSFEQYWRNNPTAQNLFAAAGLSKVTRKEDSTNGSSLELTAAQQALLEARGWHSYDAWVNASPWYQWSEDGKSGKKYLKKKHWFQTIELGDGSFELVQTNINGVLVLLDKHGWEIMRQTIVKPTDDGYDDVRDKLRKYDSPMVSQYRFYSARNVDHKTSGYHKYNINNTQTKALTESARVGADQVFTSLADYPLKMQNGAMTDLYVTYDVRENFNSTYDPAASITSTPFWVRQGADYAKANGSILNTTPDKGSDNTTKWLVKPNPNIDAEMGYSGDAITYNTTEQGFDPYNVRVESASNHWIMTTNANGGSGMQEATYPNVGPRMSLTGSPSTKYTTAWFDNPALQVTNATFMVVDDGNGNMRLMPRFDHSRVVSDFATLEAPAAAQPKGDQTHVQTTVFSTGPVTFHVIDLAGNDVFDGIAIEDQVGYVLPRKYKSPFATQYYYHKTLEHATDAATRKTSNSAIGDADVYVTYAVDPAFQDNSPWNIYGANGIYMHANYDITSDRLSGTAKWWWMHDQNKGRLGGYDFNTATLPFVDNTYAWQFGEDADPYNVRFFNRGAQCYATEYPRNGNTSAESGEWCLDFLTPNGDYNVGNNAVYRYSIVYYEEDEDNPHTILFNRAHKRYGAYDDVNQNRWMMNRADREASGQLTVTQLPKVAMNVVSPIDGVVEYTLETYHKDGCEWTSAFVPYYLQRVYTGDHKFYYTLADAKAKSNAINGAVDDSRVDASGNIYVGYTLDSEWGAEPTAGLTISIKPSPSDGKLYYYAIQGDRTEGGTHPDDRYFQVDTSNDYLSYNGSDGSSLTSGDSDDEKKYQWAFIGTPYSLKIINRTDGMSKYLGIPETGALTGSAGTATRAKMYADDEAGGLTTWELATGLGGDDTRLFLRPQGSFNGESRLLYLGWSGGHGNFDADQFCYGLKVRYMASASARMITFKLYDPDGQYMAPAVADVRKLEVVKNHDILDYFQETSMPRRFCDYTFYDDGELTSAVTTTKDADNVNNEIIYVKWNYTDKAPVFSTGTDAASFQYYKFGNYDNQVALVGNPYSLKLYDRTEKKYLTAASMTSGTAVTATAATAAGGTTWDLPVFDASTFTDGHLQVRAKGYSLYWNNNALNSTAQERLLSQIVVPLRVYKDDQETLADSMEYALNYLQHSTGDASETFTPDDLNSLNGNKEHRHAFCDYTYYTDDGFTADASAGVSFYGGKSQEHKALWATYTVDEQFYEPWLMYWNNNEPKSPRFAFLNGSHRFDNGQMTGSISTQTDAIRIAREDKTMTRQWLFKGDPYSFQIANASLDEDGVVLGAKKLDNNSGVNDDHYLYASDDATYNTFELMEGSHGTHRTGGADGTGEYLFYLRHDGQPRLTGGLWAWYPGPTVISTSNVQPDIWLTPAVEQFNITWQIVDGRSDKSNAIVGSAVAVQKLVNKGRVLTLADMPQSLQRHYCEYNNLYGHIDGGTLSEDLTETGYTVGEAKTLYVRYTLSSGAPNFVDDVPGTETTNDKYWYEMHYPEPYFYLYYNSSESKVTGRSTHDIETIRSSDDYKYYRWALIGSPYSVKYYNRGTSKYLKNDADGCSLVDGSSNGTSYTLYDDYSTERCAIYDPTAKKYVNASALMQALNWNGGTSAEFTNNNGLSGLYLVLHYGKGTLRSLDTNSDGDLDTPAAGRTETIHVTTFQQEGKSLDEVLPVAWKRAYCDYSYWWDTTNSTTTAPSAEAKDVSEAMVTNHKAHNDIYVHVTYDVNSPFRWSTPDETADGKYWYYWVSHDIKGTSKGGMVYTASDNWFRQNGALYDNQAYTNNYEWCVMGDPYGFRMRCYYDPDQKYNEYVGVSTTHEHPDHAGVAVIDCDQTGSSTQTLFEMRRSNLRWKNYFWMHPIYTAEQMEESDEYGGYSHVRADAGSSSHPILDEELYSEHCTSRNISNSTISNYTLMPLTAMEMEEYLYYKGFVNGISNDVVAASTELTALFDRIKAARASQQAGTADYSGYTPTISAAEAKLVHDALFSPGGQVQMKQGYYRIVPYNFERNDNLGTGETAGRRYMRGYLYGEGTEGYKSNGDARTSGYDDRQEMTGSGAAKTLMLNESLEKAEYDPATVFHFELTDDSHGHPRYKISTQGLWLSGAEGQPKLYEAESSAFKSRVENIGSVMAQLKLGDGNDNEYDYLSNVQNFSSNEPADERRAALRKNFASFNYTRLYLQPVSSEDNLLPLKVEVYPGKYTPEGTTEAQDFYFSTLYVPYDVVLPNGEVYAYTGKLRKKRSSVTDWRLYCEKVSKRTVGGIDYEAGKFVPAGTPVLIRAKAKEGDAPANGAAADYDRDHANTQSGYITVALRTDAPASGLTRDANYFSGQYLEQIISDTPAGDETVYIFGQSTNADYTTKTTEDKAGTIDEVGFYHNKNTLDGKTTGTANSRYVRHNKVYFIYKSDDNDYTEGEATARESAFKPATGPASDGTSDGSSSDGTSDGSSDGADKAAREAAAHPFIQLDFGDGIEEHINPDALLRDGCVYDLNGRRVATEEMVKAGVWRRNLQPGIYVINGRKVVVK